MPRVTTILGEVETDALGRVLPHEHIASVYGHWNTGRQNSQPNPAWEEEILNHYQPILTRLRQEYDCRTLVEVSPSYGFRQGRDLEVWAELSRRTGVNIVVCTGYYTERIRPENFGDLSVTQVADTMIREACEGIAGTNVRAGIIKAALDRWTADSRKLLKAAAVAQRETGLSITTHTCSPDLRRGTLDLLEGAGVPPERVVLGHADTNATPVELLSLVQRGCSLLLTIWGIQNMQLIGWGLPVLPRYHSPSLVAILVAEGYGDQVMMSVDYSAGFEDNRFVQDLYEVEGRTSWYMFTHVLATLEKMGVSAAALERIMRDNPRRMLTADHP